MNLNFRKNEGVLLLCQNNEEARIEIYAVNASLQELIGFSEEDAKGKSLQSVLSPRHAQAIDDYLKDDKIHIDLADVVNKMRDLRFRHKDGQDVPVENFKLVRIDARDRHQWFRLIIEDLFSRREMEAFKKILAENFKGHEVLDPETGLPDADSLKKDLELSHHYVGAKGMHACFAYLQVDNFKALAAHGGQKSAIEALNQAAKALRRNLRADDTIGRAAEDALGVILMDIEPETARMVMNRLRWLVNGDAPSLPDQTRKVRISIAFAQIGAEEAADLPLRCQQALAGESDTPRFTAIA